MAPPKLQTSATAAPYRRVIPERLRTPLGRREIKKSLVGSHPLDVARSNVNSFVTELLSRAGRSKTPGSFKPALDDFLGSDIAGWDFDKARRDLLEIDGEYTFSYDQIEKLSDRWIESLIQSGDVSVDYVGPPSGVWIDITVRRAQALLRDFIQEPGLKAWLGKRKGAEEALVASCNEALLAHTLPSARSDEPSRTSIQSAGARGDGIPLTEALKRYLQETGVALGTARDWRTAIDRFVAVVGRDPPIRQITSEQIVSFRDSLAGYKGPTAASPSDSQSRKLAPATINKNLHALKAVLSWSVKNKYLDANPAQGINATVRLPNRHRRLPFSSEDLSRIFGSAYSKDRHSADFWLPVLALFTGCRVEEIAQLQRADVGDERGVPFLDIRGTVKTESSIRRVPIHGVVLGLGFVEFCALRRKPTDQLFNDLKRGALGKFSAAYSKRFGRYLDKIGIREPGKVFHSFRHTFKDRCRDAEIPRQVQDALLGHAPSSTGEQYGSGFSLEKLNDWIKKLSFSEINWSAAKS